MNRKGGSSKSVGKAVAWLGATASIILAVIVALLLAGIFWLAYQTAN